LDLIGVLVVLISVVEINKHRISVMFDGCGGLKVSRDRAKTEALEARNAVRVQRSIIEREKL